MTPTLPADDSCPDCEDNCGNLEPGGCLAVIQEQDEEPREDDYDVCPPGYDGR